MEDRELAALLEDLESDIIERKESTSDGKKIRQAICAFANDLPNYKQPGILFIGVKDDGTCANLSINDNLLLNLANIRDEGKILPFPVLQVSKRIINGCELAVVIVEPSDAPPVRLDGRTYIRVGPRRGTATAEEERRLNEKRRARDLPFDLRPFISASVDDLNLEFFQREYLSSALAPEVLEENQRSLAQQLTSLRFTTPEPDSYPTSLGILVTGKEPRQFIPGFYIQFVRFDGTELTDPIVDRKEISGALIDLLRYIDEVVQANISTASDIAAQPVEIKQPNYPVVALQQLIRNAVMHRSYEETNAPVRVYWFNDRIEIQNPGGLFGQVNRQNFGKGVTDYRNPHLAEAMKTLGYVQRFGIGIPTAQKELQKNGNSLAEFTIEDSYISVTIRSKI
ncbi:ATP-binding protein [Chamaesiphon sp. VAR_69_metabat_338]|uniref:ATP-binding protein n=1 Tax=Chamaesiphon sp. VAR_69_metabat_338 TaxID=2964704 RepID=UPI00286E8609|nr:ATP-binding protein [Chamaesiphon sp. VAR_69_metabat_338]